MPRIALIGFALVGCALPTAPARVDRLNPASAANPQPFGAPPATPPVGVEIGQSYRVIGWRMQYNF